MTKSYKFLFVLKARRTLSDVGMLISIVLMGLADHIIKTYTGLETAVKFKLKLKRKFIKLIFFDVIIEIGYTG